MAVVVALYHHGYYVASTYGSTSICTTNSRCGGNDVENTILVTVLLLLLLEQGWNMHSCRCRTGDAFFLGGRHACVHSFVRRRQQVCTMILILPPITWQRKVHILVVIVADGLLLSAKTCPFDVRLEHATLLAFLRDNMTIL